MDIFFILPLLIDILLIVSLPFFVILLKCLFTERESYLGVVYTRALVNIMINCILITCIELFVVEPASFGIFLDFYISYDWLFGKFVYMKAVCFGTQLVLWNCVIALARVVAVFCPLQFQKMTSRHMMNLLTLIIWMGIVVVAAPIVWPIQFTHYDKGPNSISYGTVRPSFFHRNISVYFNPCFLILTAILHLVLICDLLFRKHSKIFLVSKSDMAKRLTLHTVLSYWPWMFTIFANVRLRLETMFPENFQPINLDLLQLFMKIGSNLSMLLTAVTMLVFFPKTRQQVFRMITGKQRSNSKVNTLTLDSQRRSS